MDYGLSLFEAAASTTAMCCCTESQLKSLSSKDWEWEWNHGNGREWYIKTYSRTYTIMGEYGISKLIPILFHSHDFIPIPTLWNSETSISFPFIPEKQFSFPWYIQHHSHSQRESHGIPVVPIPMHISTLQSNTDPRVTAMTASSLAHHIHHSFTLWTSGLTVVHHSAQVVQHNFPASWRMPYEWYLTTWPKFTKK